MWQGFYENLTCSASHLPKANFAWLVFNGRKQYEQKKQTEDSQTAE